MPLQFPSQFQLFCVTVWRVRKAPKSRDSLPCLDLTSDSPTAPREHIRSNSSCSLLIKSCNLKAGFGCVTIPTVMIHFTSLTSQIHNQTLSWVKSPPTVEHFGDKAKGVLCEGFPSLFQLLFASWPLQFPFQVQLCCVTSWRVREAPKSRDSLPCLNSPDGDHFGLPYCPKGTCWIELNL